MAKFKFNSGINSIQSKIGGQIYQTSSKGNQIRNACIFRQWRSISQLDKMSFMMQCSRHWKSLSDLQRLNWINWSTLYPQETIAQEGELISGYPLFLKRNFFKRLIEGSAFTFMTDPVLIWYDQEVVLFEISITESEIFLTANFTRGGSDLVCVFFVSNAQSPGIKFGDTRWRFSGTCSNFSQKINITESYLSTFGIMPSIDEKLFVSSVLLGKDQGQYSFHQLQSVIVQPDIPPFWPVQYGALFNFFCGVDSRKISSSDDWVVPSQTDFFAFQAFVSNFSGGGKLKETGFSYWNSPNTGATNEYGFNARGAGARDPQTGSFSNSLKISMNIWSSTTYPLAPFDQGITWRLVNFSASFGGYNLKKRSGVSIRLLYKGQGSPNSYTGNDGKLYEVIQIGSQLWTKSNICETKFRNGESIPVITSNDDWKSLNYSAMCAFNNDQSLAPF